MPENRAISYILHMGKLNFRIYTLIVKYAHNLLILQQIKNIGFAL